MAAAAISYSRDDGGNLVVSPEGDDARSAEIAFQEFFSGHRGSARQTVSLIAAVQGSHGIFKATVIDISRCGVLLHIDDESFEPPPSKNRLLAYSGLVRFHFERGLRLGIESTILTDADIVRIATSVDDPACAVYLAVQLQEDITDEQCKILGLDLPAACEDLPVRDEERPAGNDD
ncbi:MAG: hypothetical protein V3T86_00410 [Planctomycetota bacterium]